MTYEIFSTRGRLLGTTHHLEDARQKLSRWSQAEFVIAGGNRIALVKEEQESRHTPPDDDLPIPCSMSA